MYIYTFVNSENIQNKKLFFYFLIHYMNILFIFAA